MKRISINLFSSISVMSVLSLLWLPSPACGGGTVTGWGSNGSGQINPCASNVIAIAAGYDHSALLKNDGTVAVCGTQIVPANLTNVVAVSAGDYYTLALKADGKVVAWGAGFLTDGQTNVPPDLTNVVAISAGSKHSLALKADGTLVSWGRNSSGQTNVPPDLTNVVAVSGGGIHSLALKADGTAVGWGNFYPGYSLTNLLSLSNLVALSAGDGGYAIGYETWLALQADGVLIRQSSHSTTTSNILTNVVAISASRGTDHHISLALMADGTVTPILGYNFGGGPDVPPGLSNVVAVAAGDGHDLALVGDGPPVFQAPFVLNPTWDTNGFKAFVPTQSGRVYRLEYKNALTDTDWIALPLVAGNGGIQTLNDPSATGTQRFYRARHW